MSYCVSEKDSGCVPIQGQHPSECAFEVQLRHNAAQKAVPIQRILQMHRNYPLQL